MCVCAWRREPLWSLRCCTRSDVKTLGNIVCLAHFLLEALRLLMCLAPSQCERLQRCVRRCRRHSCRLRRSFGVVDVDDACVSVSRCVCDVIFVVFGDVVRLPVVAIAHAPVHHGQHMMKPFGYLVLEELTGVPAGNPSEKGFLT